MRVLNLCLPDFKNLQNFAIDFSHESSVAVLVGRNGAGKSNVLEALTLISEIWTWRNRLASIMKSRISAAAIRYISKVVAVCVPLKLRSTAKMFLLIG